MRFVSLDWLLLFVKCNAGHSLWFHGNWWKIEFSASQHTRLPLTGVRSQSESGTSLPSVPEFLLWESAASAITPSSPKRSHRKLPVKHNSTDRSERLDTPRAIPRGDV